MLLGFGRRRWHVDRLLGGEDEEKWKTEKMKRMDVAGGQLKRSY